MKFLYRDNIILKREKNLPELEIIEVTNRMRYVYCVGFLYGL